MKPTPNLHISVVQTDIHWEQPKANLNHFEDLLSSVEDTDLILLPEMFTTGFTNHLDQIKEDDYNNTVTWLKKLAQTKSAVVTGSIACKESNLFYNRLLWVTPQGETKCYDKKHLFSLAKEDQYYTAGQERKIFSLNAWDICPMICYDLRFPVWSRRIKNEFDYQFLFYLASWPEARIDAWTSLLKARAIENMSYVAGVNRIGKDGSDLNYPGHSVVFDPFGKKILEFEENKEGVHSIELNLEFLNRAREKLNFQADADSYLLK